MAHCEKLTTMLQAAWDVLASVLAGRVRMQNINIQDGDLLLLFEPERSSDEIRNTLTRSGFQLAQISKAMGKTLLVLVVPHGQSVEAIDPAILEAHGWQRPSGQSQASPQPEVTTTP